MKTYKFLLNSLPSNTVVIAIDKCEIPSLGHQFLVNFVKKIAEQNDADHIIYSPKKSYLNQKLHYLNIIFPNVNFVDEFDLNIIKEKYKNVIMIVSDDEKKNNSCKTISVGKSTKYFTDFETKLKTYAVKGNFELFKKNLPTTIREVDIKRLMNDVRYGMNLESIKEQVIINAIRNKFYKKEIYNVGDVVESLTGEELKIIKRGTNNVICENIDGITYNKSIHEIFQKEN